MSDAITVGDASERTKQLSDSLFVTLSMPLLREIFAKPLHMSNTLFLSSSVSRSIASLAVSTPELLESGLSKQGRFELYPDELLLGLPLLDK
jgi:hypothetical protein